MSTPCQSSNLESIDFKFDMGLRSQTLPMLLSIGSAGAAPGGAEINSSCDFFQDHISLKNMQMQTTFCT
jgi:hypothetical protein